MDTFGPETTVGQLVVDRPARARVFERNGIDYCCGGRLTLADACAKRGLDPRRIIQEIGEQDRGSQEEPSRDWSRASAAALADHIEATHHAYLRRELPRLSMLTSRVADAHGQHRRGLVELRNVFEKFACELNLHMMKEERVLFPMIRELEGGSLGGAPSVAHPVSAMIHEHDDAGRALAQMRTLTDGFTPPLDACGTYRAMLDGLRELEADMHAHVHKENNILFPMALGLESKARGGVGGACCCTPRSAGSGE